MKGLWQHTAALWLVCVVWGATCAVFYTENDENNYPRIGRRAFFTLGDKGSSYPRIGRRSSPPGLTRHVITGSGSSTGFRSHGERSTSSRVSPLEEEKNGLELSAPAAARMMTSLGDPDVVGIDVEEGEEEDAPWLPLGLLFFSFDENDDRVLTREEFVQGMLRARDDDSIC